MGFFSDLKDDLAQAVNELTDDNTEKELAESEAKLKEEIAALEAEDANENDNIDEILQSESVSLDDEMKAYLGVEGDGEILVGDILEREAFLAESGDKDSETSVEDLLSIIDEAEAKEDEAAEVKEEEIPEEFVETSNETKAEPEAVKEEPMEEPMEEPKEETKAVNDKKSEKESKNNKENKGVFEKMEGKIASDETAVITSGMSVKGDISSEGSVDVLGKIEGNIDILGKLNVSGQITGDSKAAEIFADSAKITGELYSEGSIKIGQASVIIGNVIATSAVIAGAVKGDIDVKGPVILDTSAIVMGDIKSKSVQINNGAVIEGKCSQCYADVSPTSFFDNLDK